jgi:hypothetical protein
MAAKRKLIVKDNPDLVRDSHSKAIVNVNRGEYLKWKSRKKMLRDKDKRLSELEQEVSNIKKLLQELTNK